MQQTTHLIKFAYARLITDVTQRGAAGVRWSPKRDRGMTKELLDLYSDYLLSSFGNHAHNQQPFWMLSTRLVLNSAANAG